MDIVLGQQISQRMGPDGGRTRWRWDQLDFQDGTPQPTEKIGGWQTRIPKNFQFLSISSFDCELWSEKVFNPDATHYILCFGPYLYLFIYYKYHF